MCLTILKNPRSQLRYERTQFMYVVRSGPAGIHPEQSSFTQGGAFDSGANVIQKMRDLATYLSMPKEGKA